MNKHTKKRRFMKGGDCGCNTPVVVTGGCSTCGMTGGGCNCGLKGGSANLDQLPSSNFYKLNDYNHDPNMLQESVRISGVPISIVKGGKKHKKSKKTKKSKTPKAKKTKKHAHKMKGGLNLGYSAINSSLGHGHFGTFFGAPTLETPAWNSSIFSHPTNTNYTGYNQFNPYLV
jgi:hypothetical protein